MVDVAAIFDEVFGPEDRSKGLPENGCARCVSVPDGHKPLENIDKPDTPTEHNRHTAKQGVPSAVTWCVRNIVEKQCVTVKDRRCCMEPVYRAAPPFPFLSVDFDAHGHTEGCEVVEAVHRDGGFGFLVWQGAGF